MALKLAKAAPAPNGRVRSRAKSRDAPGQFPLTTSRAELLVAGRDKEFRHLVHSLFGFASHHERIRAGHAKLIGLAGIEYTVLISIPHFSQNAHVTVKTYPHH